MAASSYQESLARLLAHEGGYTNHPSDPGGPTNFGITIADYRRYGGHPNATAADVRAMQLGEAKAIYRAKYWDAQRCDQLPAGLDDTVFDYGVNSGIGRSGKVLRRVLGLSDSTSVINDEVLRAVAGRDVRELIVAINDERLRFLKSLRTWPVFGAGWGRRVAEVKTFSLQLAAGGRGVVPAAAVSGLGVDPDEHASTLALQRALAARGFDPGAIDGDMRPKTEAAIRAFQKSARLAPDGVAGLKTKAALGLGVKNAPPLQSAPPPVTMSKPAPTATSTQPAPSAGFFVGAMQALHAALSRKKG